MFLIIEFQIIDSEKKKLSTVADSELRWVFDCLDESAQHLFIYLFIFFFFFFLFAFISVTRVQVQNT